MKSWVFGGTLPVVLLTVEGDTRGGLGNSIVYGEWRASVSTDKSIGFGLQVELPWGASGGVADAHWVLLPYVNAHLPVWRLFFMANLGYAQSVGGLAHDHGAHDHGSSHIGEEFVFVNPHESGEFVYRLSIGLPLYQQRIQPMLMVNGQQVLVDTTGEKTFVQLGARVLGQVTDVVSVYSMGELPISKARRFTGRASIGLMLDFKADFLQPLRCGFEVFVDAISAVAATMSSLTLSPLRSVSAHRLNNCNRPPPVESDVHSPSFVLTVSLVLRNPRPSRGITTSMVNDCRI